MNLRVIFVRVDGAHPLVEVLPHLPPTVLVAHTARPLNLQPDQINMVMFFWYLVKCEFLFLQGSRTTRPFIIYVYFVTDH